MFTSSRKFLLLLLMLGCNSSLRAQSSETIQRKAELDSLANKFVKVHAGQVVMSRRADSLAQAITRLKSRPASPLNERALDAAYRDSQTLADTLQKAQSEEQYLDQLLRQKAEHLLKNLSHEIMGLVQNANEAKTQRDQKKYAQFTRAAQVCRQWQKQCQEILASPPTTILIYEVRVHPDDDAATLLRKADFLHDQADRLEREGQRLKQKLTELREEATLRSRMTEFAQDLALLEPSNESAQRNPNTGRSDFENSGFNDGSLAGVVNANREAFSSAEVLIALSWPEQVSELSLQDLSDWQKRLRQAQKRLHTQADSLKQKAEELEALSRVRQELQE